MELFNFNGADVRIVVKDNEPWFVLKDVCDVLEITNSGNAKARLAEGFHSTDTLSTKGGMQEVIIINEAGLYQIIFQSRKPEAEKFVAWVTGDVLPTIRKHGMYATEKTLDQMLEDPDTMIHMIQRLKEEKDKARQLQEQIAVDKPKVIFAEALEVSKSSMLVGELAKTLKKNGIEIGQNRLFEKLRNDGYLMKTKGDQWNAPTQRSMDMGLFEVKMRTINDPDGTVHMVRTTKVTMKGCSYFINKFKRGELVELS